MKRNSKRNFTRAGVLFLAFAVFTVLTAVVDVQPIGPKGSKVGFAAVNQAVFRYLGADPRWEYVTDWVGVLAVVLMLAFAVTGLRQLIGRRSIRKVDGAILLLGGLYALMMAFYVFFENVVINYRPVLAEGFLEASYPSSHTVLVLCVMITAAVYIRTSFSDRKALCRGAEIAAVVCSVVTAAGRLLAGVHWVTDIVGGVLLSAALTALYRAALEWLQKRKV